MKLVAFAAIIYFFMRFRRKLMGLGSPKAQSRMPKPPKRKPDIQDAEWEEVE